MSRLRTVLSLVFCCVLVLGGVGCGSKVAPTWTNLSPIGDLPSARAGHSLVYDPASGKVILFGGASGSTYLDDTWAYDPAANTWTELRPAGTVPSARSGHSMVYDPSDRKVILFGGVDGGGRLNDTWAYDPAANTWTELKPAGAHPAMRWAHSMVYDSADHKVILFGGYEWGAGGPRNDTWAYDPVANAWTELKPAGSVPPERAGHSMAYDSAGGRVILFGGNSGGGDYFILLNDTWAYDPKANTWTKLDPAGGPPSERWLHSMVYDPVHSRAILYSGWNGTAGGGVFNDTWAYGSSANTWTKLAPAGALPPAREAHGMIYASGTGGVILFGGWANGIDLNDTWALYPGD